MTNITTNELAVELKASPRETRKFLRSITPKDEQPGKGSRWVIAGGKRELTKLQKQYNEWHKSQLEAAAKRAAEAVVEAEGEVSDDE